MGPTDRIIVLIDMDCFYCQVEEKLDARLEGKPIAVVQYNEWRGGGIIAVNYPARDRGVTRHMRGNDAKKKCPEIKLVRVPQVRGKADLSKYRDAGKRVADVLASFTPSLERASVDEAYLDITELVKNKIETNLNDLTINNLTNTFVVGNDTQDFIDIVLMNREFSDDNLKLAVGGLIVEEIRRKVFEITGYKCSAGIAHNKILAKLVCALHKPNKQTILPQNAVEKFFETMPINKIKSLGGKFGQTLSEDLQITYMGQMVKFTEKELVQKYDEKTGNWLYNIARGVDLEPVTPKLVSKSIACCKNFTGKSALITSESVQHWLSELAEEMAERLDKDLKENNRKAKQIIVSFTQENNRRETTSSRTQPLVSYESKKIAQNAFELIKKFCLQTDGSFHLKFLGLSAGHFEDVKNVREITSFFKSGQISEISPRRKSTVSCLQLVYNTGKVKGEENVDPMDCADVEPNVYLQLTQELDEDVDDLVYYDDSFRIKQELNSVSESCINDKQKKRYSSKSPSSFFEQYFGRVNQFDKCSDELTDLTNCESVATEEELTEVCPDCNKNIPESEVMSHKDYHFALTLMKSESQPQKLTQNNNNLDSKNKGKKHNKRKAAGSKDLMSFFKNNTSDDSSNFTETCPECNRRLKSEDVSSHMDYHVAKKIHLEINAPSSGRDSGECSVKTKVNKNVKIANNGKTVISFFKRL